jgi:hypothetical protein
MKVIGTLRCIETISPDAWFLYPQYKQNKNGEWEFIENPYEMFPNRKNIRILDVPNNIDNWRNKVVFAEIDMNNISATHEPNNPNSCKYVIDDSLNITFPREKEIIEVIDITDNNIDINDIIYKDSLRTINIHEPLNKRIILIIENYAYGCFEYKKIGNEFYDGKADYKLITTPNTNGSPEYHIRRYSKKEIEKYIKNVQVYNDIHTTNPQYRGFIIEQDILDKEIKIEKVLDFIPDRNLINMLYKSMKDIPETQLTKAMTRKIIDTINNKNDFDIEFKEERIKRLAHMENLTGEILEFRAAFIEEYFRTDEGQKAKNEYLENRIKNDPSIIKEAAKDSIQFNETIKELTAEKNQKIKEIRKLREEIENIQVEKEEYEKEILENQKEKIEKNKKILEKLEAKKAEVEQELEQIKDEYNLVKEYKEIKEDVDKLLARRDSTVQLYKDAKKDLKNYRNELEEFNEFTIKRIREKISETIDTKLIGELLNPTRAIYDVNIRTIQDEEIESDIGLEELITYIEEQLTQAGRRLNKDEIINYLICITQGFMTVFAGEPGIGKTSLTQLLAKTLGLYEKGFLQIPVGRGWSSSKDLIGYYNVLSNRFEKAPTGFYDCLYTLDHEYKEGKYNIPYFCLLDEANLSPIEHYWSIFMGISDDFVGKAIDVGNNEKLYLNKGFRFLATINFDHTTEQLSPRFLDRAWIILLKGNDIDNILENGEDKIENNSKIIDFTLLEKYFMPSKEETLKPQLEAALKAVNNKLREKEIYIGNRTLKMVKNYCLAAQKIDYMVDDNQFKPLDYAISQKILPLLNGYGSEYKQTLEKLNQLCREYSLQKSSEIIKDIMRIGDSEHGCYQFFNR